MSTDLIFDAINYIDDDMLEDVDVLRSRKSVKPTNMWKRYVSVAACACFVFCMVLLVSQSGWFDNITTKDKAEHEVFDDSKEVIGNAAMENAAEDDYDGQCRVHSYVRAEITADDAFAQTITEAKSITAIFDILHSLDSTESENDNLYNKDDKQEPSEESLDFAVTESASGTVAVKQYRIMLVTADGSEVVYTLTGKHVKNEATGMSYILREEQYDELMGVLSNK